MTEAMSKERTETVVYPADSDVSKRKANDTRELERSRNLLNSVRNLFNNVVSDTAQIRDHLEGFKIRFWMILKVNIYKSRNSTEALRLFN